MGTEWQPLLRYYEAAEVTEGSAELPIGLGHSIYKCSVTKVSQEDLVPGKSRQRIQSDLVNGH